MMTNLFKGTLFGGIIVYIWLMISWMALPWHCAGFSTFQNENAVTSCILQNAQQDGLYLLPNLCGSTDKQKFEMNKNSPIVFASVQHKGFEAVSYKHYLTSLIIQLIGALLITFLLQISRLPFYWVRVLFATLIGLLVGILGVLPNWNWWGFPLSYVSVEVLDYVIGWFLGGLVISFFTRP